MPKAKPMPPQDPPDAMAWMVHDLVGVPVLLPLAWLDRGDYQLAPVDPHRPPDVAGGITPPIVAAEE